jgi:hypothetical protein
MPVLFSQLKAIFDASQYRNNFTESGLCDLHEHLTTCDSILMDPCAICEIFEETKISDLYVPIVDRSEFQDYEDDEDNTHAYYTAVIHAYQGSVFSSIPKLITGEELIIVSKW